MLSAGRVVADGSPSEVKAVVSGRRIRANADFEWNVDIEQELAGLPGVRSLEHRGAQFTLVSDDSDATLRSLLSAYQDIHDIEVTSHTMDDAFLALTEGRSGFDAEPASRAEPASLEEVAS